MNKLIYSVMKQEKPTVAGNVLAAVESTDD